MITHYSPYKYLVDLTTVFIEGIDISTTPDPKDENQWQDQQQKIWKTITKKAQTEVSGREWVDKDSRKVNNYDLLLVIDHIIDKGRVQVVCSKIADNPDGLVYFRLYNA